jgi:hypothetical protein
VLDILDKGACRACDLPVGVMDDPEFLQLARGFGDIITAYAEHSRNEFLGYGQLVGR